MTKILDLLSNRKNTAFLVTCLYVHFTSFLYFLYLGAIPLAVTNVCSSLIYILLIATHREPHSRNIMIAYIEIIAFSVTCEFITIGNCGYIFFPLGMVAVIFHLVQTDKVKRVLLQMFGIAGAFLTLFQIETDFEPLPSLAVDLGKHRVFVAFWNLLVAVITMVYVSFLYIAEQEKNKAILEYNMNHDQLTGLYNRRFFYSAIGTINKTARNYSLAMADLDNFKKINDTYGHEFGDEVLKALSDIFKKHLEENDIAVRWGGEEFILFMPGTDPDHAFKRLESILEEIRAQKIKTGNTTVTFTATIGLSSGEDPASYEQVIARADQNLYYGKYHGKNRIITDDFQEQTTAET